MQQYTSISAFQEATRRQLSAAHYHYLPGGSADSLTLQRNKQAFGLYQLRPRRLVDMRCSFFWETWPRLFFIASVGFQKLFAPEGALHTVRACAQKDQLMLASTVTHASYTEIAAQFPKQRPWFQLYPPTDRNITKRLVQQTERAEAKVLVCAENARLARRYGRDGIYISNHSVRQLKDLDTIYMQKARPIL